MPRRDSAQVLHQPRLGVREALPRDVQRRVRLAGEAAHDEGPRDPPALPQASSQIRGPEVDRAGVSSPSDPRGGGINLERDVDGRYEAQNLEGGVGHLKCRRTA